MNGQGRSASPSADGLTATFGRPLVSLEAVFLLTVFVFYNITA